MVKHIPKDPSQIMLRTDASSAMLYHGGMGGLFSDVENSAMWVQFRMDKTDYGAFKGELGEGLGERDGNFIKHMKYDDALKAEFDKRLVERSAQLSESMIEHLKSVQKHVERLLSTLESRDAMVKFVREQEESIASYYNPLDYQMNLFKHQQAESEKKEAARKAESKRKGDEVNAIIAFLGPDVMKSIEKDFTTRRVVSAILDLVEPDFATPFRAQLNNIQGKMEALEIEYQKCDGVDVFDSWEYNDLDRMWGNVRDKIVGHALAMPPKTRV